MPLTFTDDDFAETDQSDTLTFTPDDFEPAEPPVKKKRPPLEIPLSLRQPRVPGSLEPVFPPRQPFIEPPIGAGPAGEITRAFEATEKIGAIEPITPRGALLGVGIQIPTPPPQRLESALKTGMETDMPFPRLSTREGEILAGKTVGPVVAGAQNFVADMADFFTSPIGMATLASGGVAAAAGAAGLPTEQALVHRATMQAFATDMARNFPEQAQGIAEAYRSGDVREATRQTLGLLPLVGVGAGAVKTTIEPRTRVTQPKPKIEREVPSAIQEREAAKVLPDVQTQPAVEPAPVPAKEGDLGVRTRSETKEGPAPSEVLLSPVESMAKLEKMSQPEALALQKHTGYGGGAQGWNYEVGASARTKADVDALANAWLKFKDKGEKSKAIVTSKTATPAEKMAAMNEGALWGVKSGFAGEAYEAATGHKLYPVKGKPGEYRTEPVPDKVKWIQERVPDYEPPMAPKEEAGAPATPYFDPQSEALGLGRPSTAPTVEDIRAQRAQEAKAAKPKFQLTFQQFLNAPREGPLLEALRTLPKPERTSEQVASQQKLDKASEAVNKAGLSWIYDRADPAKKNMVEAGLRRLPKTKQKIVDAYEKALDEHVKSTTGERESRQRSLYDRAVSAGIIESPEITKAEKPKIAPEQAMEDFKDLYEKANDGDSLTAAEIDSAIGKLTDAQKKKMAPAIGIVRRIFEKQQTLPERAKRFGEPDVRPLEVGAEEKSGAQQPEPAAPTPEAPITVPPVKPPEPPPIETTEATGGSQKYGIAQRVREERAAAGQVEPVEPGKGVSAPDSVEHGRDLLQTDPQAGVKALAAFEADPQKGISADGMAATRAHGEYLAKAAKDMEERYGTDSEQYRAARKELSDWDKRTKPMQTEWHKIGKAQQGETDIDTGTFTGLSRAYEEQTGKQFTPDQAKTAKDISGRKKKADQAATEASRDLNEQIVRATMTDAEKRAFDAAKKTVRENAVRLADAENKARVAEEVRKQAIDKIQEDAKKKAEAAGRKNVTSADIRAARAENQARVDEAARAKGAADAEVRAAEKAMDASSKTVRQWAIRRTAAENKLRTATTERAKRVAAVQLEALKRAQEASSKTVREAARARAQKAAKDRAMDPHTRVLTKAREYIEELGMDNLDDIRNKIATDLGMTLKQVTALLAKSPRVKFMMDDVWKKKQTARKLEQTAKRWLTETAQPLWRRAIATVPRVLFGLKVGFHGTVALGTHAPTKAFDPRFWKIYGQNFAKMYRMVGSKSYYEMTMQDMMRRPNYTVARRAGLQNDPFQYEEFADPAVTAFGGAGLAKGANMISKPFAQAYNAMTEMGNRGYSVLKVLRQDMFDQHWNQLPKTLQFPEMAEAISDAVNHDTGVTKTKAPSGTEIALFAPRLAASRIAWLTADPAKSVATFANWKNASQADKWFAIEQVKSKAWVGGTLYSLLALNQGLLSATDSDQKVNFTDPFHSDFLKFKVGGMSLSYGNPMLTMMRLPVRLFRIREGEGKLKNLVYPDENTYSVLGEYGRSQLSPFASLVTSLWLKGDWQNRPLPGSDRPVPKRLRAQGVEPYTWKEFWAEQLAPIPVEEAMREVWKNGLGMDDAQYRDMRKAFATWSVMSATGARLTEDIPSTDVPATLPP